ncbi:MAG: carbohydrate ABC transporter permease [Defluviitaleaceae bacterium]|nr:carbohydrate ABC transporter permease [Defluviitaleaceae bacterium]
MKLQHYGRFYKVFYVINILFLAFLAALCILPLINILAVSLSTSHYVAAGRVSFWPVGFTNASYAIALRDARFWNSFSISVQRTVIGSAVNLFMTILVAYPLSKDSKYFPGRNRYMMFVFITMMFNGGLVPTFLVVHYTGLIDSIWSLILPGAVNAWFIVLMLNFFRQLPKEIEEAAIIDGAGHMTILWKIILPVSKASIATITLFAMVSHWNSWFDGMIYMRTLATRPLATYLQSLLTADVARELGRHMPAEAQRYMSLLNTRTLRAAIVFLNALPIIMVYPFLQKYFAKGLVLGSVKG